MFTVDVKQQCNKNHGGHLCGLSGSLSLGLSLLHSPPWSQWFFIIKSVITALTSRGAVVKWLEQLGYGAESLHIV